VTSGSAGVFGSRLKLTAFDNDTVFVVCKVMEDGGFQYLFRIKCLLRENICITGGTGPTVIGNGEPPQSLVSGDAHHPFAVCILVLLHLPLYFFILRHRGSSKIRQCQFTR
jgi:hypothetical protein